MSPQKQQGPSNDQIQSLQGGAPLQPLPPRSILQKLKLIFLAANYVPTRKCHRDQGCKEEDLASAELFYKIPDALLVTFTLTYPM